MGERVSTDFKSSNRIKLSWLVQVLLNFTDSRGPLLGGWQVGGFGWGLVWVCRGMPNAHMHMHACTHIHAHMHMHACTHIYARTHIHVKHDKHDKHGCLHWGGHLQFLYMHIHVHLCGDTPIPPDTPTHLPPPQEPQGAQNTKIQ